MENMLRELGRRAAQVRVQQGMTQSELAVRAGLSDSSVSNFERTGVITTSRLVALLKILEREQEVAGLFREVEEYASLDDFEKANQTAGARRVRKRK